MPEAQPAEVPPGPAAAGPEGQQWSERSRGGFEPGYRDAQPAAGTAPSASPGGGHSGYPERGPQVRYQAERDWEAGSLAGPPKPESGGQYRHAAR
jgi:hypothetical protein